MSINITAIILALLVINMKVLRLSMRPIGSPNDSPNLYILPVWGIQTRG